MRQLDPDSGSVRTKNFLPADSRGSNFAPILPECILKSLCGRDAGDVEKLQLPDIVDCDCRALTSDLPQKLGIGRRAGSGREFFLCLCKTQEKPRTTGTLRNYRS